MVRSVIYPKREGTVATFFSSAYIKSLTFFPYSEISYYSFCSLCFSLSTFSLYISPIRRLTADPRGPTVVVVGDPRLDQIHSSTDPFAGAGAPFRTDNRVVDPDQSYSICTLIWFFGFNMNMELTISIQGAVVMASSAAGATGWYRGRVKAVPSGDCLVIVAITANKPGPPPEKTITLSSLIAPRLARRGGIDEPFAWDSREYLRKLCIGKEVAFRVDYAVPSIGREFGSVFLGDKNVAMLVVSEGWAKVREQGQQKGEASPFLAELLRLEEQAKQEGLGRWSKVPGAAEASIRSLPPSAIGDPSNLDAMSLLAANKGRPMQGIVEQVRDGSTVRVYLLPDFQFVQVFVAGIQAPSMGRRAAPEPVLDAEVISDETNGDVSAEPRAPLTSAQRVAASTASSIEAADPFAAEAKYFTEIRALNREVRIVLEGVDKFSNLIGSVYYPDGESAKDLALELVENGLAKYVEWSANMMEEDAKRRLKAAELQAKKTRLRIWTNYVPPATNSKAIHDQNFTGKVIEIVSGDCIIVADDAIPYGSPSAERRVNLSSIRCPKIGNPRRDEKPAPYAREAKEFLRTRILGRQVNVQMEYSRKVGSTDVPTAAIGSTDSRVMDFGSVFLVSPIKVEGDDVSGTASSTAGSQPAGVNVAELVIGRGFGTVIRHRDFEERSNYYDALLAAESRAISGKKGIHSAKDPPVMHITDLVTASSKKARDFLPFLQRARKIPAVVEYVFSGHRFKVLLPKETCSIALSLSGVRCPGRDEPYSEEAIALMRRKIMQRDVEIEVETVDRNGTFLGSLWESRSNVAVALLEAGLAKLQTSFGSDRIPDIHLLEKAEQSAKNQKLKIWENYVEGEEVSNGAATENKQAEVLKVVVTEVLGGGKFYVQTVGDQKIAAIQQQLASLNLQEAPVIGAFNPKKGDIVLAQFSADNSWNRALIVNAPRGAVESPKETFEVFYIDYGNQEVVPYSQLRPIEPSVSAAPGLAQLCSLAYIKVPSLEEDFGEEAAEYLSHLTLSSSKEFRAKVEERDSSGGKVKGQGTGTILSVTLVAVDAEISVNAAIVQEGLARLEKRKRWGSKDKQLAFENLEKFQVEARKDRLGMWRYGDIESDDEDAAPARKAAAGRR
ncbi:Nuclease domain-containing protein [Trema orientale]|uniref:Nuclease domain-containing protein n=1 Tax=Trema orientale TaxID=63057 RepID=A0A2P5FIB0_TREOI|nr:Nuclease domain-containing protein [Trema orientale]